MQIIDFPKLMWVSDRTIRFAFNAEISQGSFLAVQHFNQFIHNQLGHNIIEIVPAYYTLTVYLKKRQPLDIANLTYQWIQYQHSIGGDRPISRVLRIPVCYDEEFALDMERVIEHTNLSFEELVAIHTSTPYSVYLIGFLPGFPYLGELDPRLHVPRLQTPRKLVTASSVGIGGHQTGIYPIDSPGGWNIIGKTPCSLFDVSKDEPTLFQTGDRVTFYEITKKEYFEILSNETTT